MTFTTDQPVQIIENINGSRTLDTSHFKILKKKPTKIFCISGPFRKGKSTLLNHLLDIKQGGFQTSSLLIRKTVGFWMWIKDEGDHYTIFLDSEGLFDTEHDSELDLQILALSMLLSSFLIINTTEKLDRSLLDECYAATQLLDGIDSSKNLMMMFLLRDFHLQLEDPQTYMMNIFSTKEIEKSAGDKNKNEMIKMRNAQKSQFLEKFKDRLFCETLVSPVSNKGDLKNLDNDPSLIRETFKLQLGNLVDRIHKLIPIKNIQIEGSTVDVTGENIASIFQSFVDDINKCGDEMLKLNPNVEDDQEMFKGIHGFMESLKNEKRPHVATVKVPNSVKNLKIYTTFEQQFEKLFSFEYYFQFEETLGKSIELKSSSIIEELQFKCKEIYTKKVNEFNGILNVKFENEIKRLQQSLDVVSNSVEKLIENIVFPVPNSIVNMKKLDFQTHGNVGKGKLNEIDQLENANLKSQMNSLLMTEIIQFKRTFANFDEFCFKECQTKIAGNMESMIEKLSQHIDLSAENVKLKLISKKNEIFEGLKSLQQLEKQFELIELQKVKEEEEKKIQEMLRLEVEKKRAEQLRIEDHERKMKIEMEALENERKRVEAVEIEMKRKAEEIKRAQEAEKKRLEEIQYQEKLRFHGAYLAGTWRIEHPWNDIPLHISFTNFKIYGESFSGDIAGTTGAANWNGNNYTLTILNDNHFTINNASIGHFNCIRGPCVRQCIIS